MVHLSALWLFIAQPSGGLYTVCTVLCSAMDSRQSLCRFLKLLVSSLPSSILPANSTDFVSWVLISIFSTQHDHWGLFRFPFSTSWSGKYIQACIFHTKEDDISIFKKYMPIPIVSHTFQDFQEPCFSYGTWLCC